MDNKEVLIDEDNYSITDYSDDISNEEKDDNLSSIDNKILDENIKKIFSYKFSKLTDFEILEYQNLVIGVMRNTLRNKENYDTDEFIKNLTWLIDGSKYLSNKLSLITFHHKCSYKSSSDSIPRSSYQFCSFNYDCEFNYNTKKKLGCYAQHYVHNLVYADLCALKKYMLKYDNMEEIQKSINTISYVINHMFEELENANKFNYFNNKNNHIERKPKKTKSKKKN
jgi:hypothetical protein